MLWWSPSASESSDGWWWDSHLQSLHMFKNTMEYPAAGQQPVTSTSPPPEHRNIIFLLLQSRNSKLAPLQLLLQLPMPVIIFTATCASLIFLKRIQDTDSLRSKLLVVTTGCQKTSSFPRLWLNGFLGIVPWRIHNGKDPGELHGATVLADRHTQGLKTWKCWGWVHAWLMPCCQCLLLGSTCWEFVRLESRLENALSSRTFLSFWNFEYHLHGTLQTIGRDHFTYLCKALWVTVSVGESELPETPRSASALWASFDIASESSTFCFQEQQAKPIVWCSWLPVVSPNTANSCKLHIFHTHKLRTCHLFSYRKTISWFRNIFPFGQNHFCEHWPLATIITLVIAMNCPA